MTRKEHGLQNSITRTSPKRKQKMKRGFARKADALQYEREFLLRLSGSSDVTFNTLRESYIDYKRTRVKASTLRNLEYCLTGQIAPYFDERQSGIFPG